MTVSSSKDGGRNEGWLEAVFSIVDIALARVTPSRIETRATADLFRLASAGGGESDFPPSWARLRLPYGSDPTCLGFESEFDGSRYGISVFVKRLNELRDLGWEPVDVAILHSRLSIDHDEADGTIDNMDVPRFLFVPEPLCNHAIFLVAWDAAVKNLFGNTDVDLWYCWHGFSSCKDGGGNERPLLGVPAPHLLTGRTLFFPVFGVRLQSTSPPFLHKATRR